MSCALNSISTFLLLLSLCIWCCCENILDVYIYYIFVQYRSVHWRSNIR
jgi:hypothetical protein